jgi:hypothetical protein
MMKNVFDDFVIIPTLTFLNFVIFFYFFKNELIFI